MNAILMLAAGAAFSFGEVSAESAEAAIGRSAEKIFPEDEG